MIPAAANKQVETHLPNETVGFQIKASAKAFKILSSNLYQDKPRAILRELGCNALDAHVANSNPDEPFIVKLPNRMNEELMIQDFGPGLSHEAMSSLYVTFFDSDKTATNDLVGGLGLGSKSPFSYTDSFTVTSNHDGMSRVYAAFINEEESPAITLISETKMGEDDRTGLKIQIPVKHADAREFAHAAKTVFSHFPVKPEIGIEIEEPDYNHTIGNARIKTHRWNNRSKVIMGPVAYTLHSDHLPDHVRRRYQHILGDIDFVVPIGELSIAASRETLSYDKHTLTNLEKILHKTEQDIATEINKQIADADTYHTAVKKARELSTFLRVKQDLFWQGVRIYTEHTKVRYAALMGIEGIRGTTSSLYYTKTPKIRYLRNEERIVMDDIDCIIIKDTENSPYVRRLEQIKDTVTDYDNVLTIVIPIGYADFFRQHRLTQLQEDFPNAKIIQLSKIKLEKNTSGTTGRIASKTFFSRVEITTRESDGSWRAYTQYRFLPRFNAYEDNPNFDFNSRLKNGALWAGFSGNTQTVIPPEFETEELFNEDIYWESFSHFMAAMVTNVEEFFDKEIIGVPRALEKEQPSDMAKNAAYIALNALKRLATDEEYCKARAYYEYEKETSHYQTDHYTEKFIKAYRHAYPESGVGITAEKLYDAAKANVGLKYSKKFIKVTYRVMQALDIELQFTHFVSPQQRWTTFISHHRLFEWAREINHREDNSGRVVSLMKTIEQLYT